MNIVKRMLEFFKESKEELRKVTWPDRDEVTKFTMVVVVSVCIMAVFLWFVDHVILEIIKFVM